MKTTDYKKNQRCGTESRPHIGFALEEKIYQEECMNCGRKVFELDDSYKN